MNRMPFMAVSAFVSESISATSNIRRGVTLVEEIGDEEDRNCRTSLECVR